MKRSVLAQLAELDQLSRASLKRRWQELFGTDPPAYGRALLIRRLAYRIQELAYGGLSGEAQAQLNGLARGAIPQKNGARSSTTQTDQTKPAGQPPRGTRLIREFRDVRYEVLVAERGFEFEGRKYRSLSAIAREITGTQWNGPAFFGLRGKGAKGNPR